MTSLKEIAAACGVSVATASKALNGYPDVGKKTTLLVQNTAKKMGYLPNSLARAMRTKTTHNLGVLFIDKMQSGLQHEYFSSLLESFKATAESKGYDITFITQHLISNQSMTYLEHCLYRNCDGVLIASVDFHDPMVTELANSNIPVVTIDYIFDGCSAILSDNFGGMKLLTEYVISKGHTDIAFIHGEQTTVTQKRLAGFFKACQQANLKIPKKYIYQAGYHDPKSSEQATRALLTLTHPPTCIFYPDDFSFVGGMNELERQGLHIPYDISVAGYDGILLSQVLRPRLTTLKQDSLKIGQAAAAKLIENIEHPDTFMPEQVMIDGYLLEGQTINTL